MNDNAETVILIHGLWMHGVVLLPYQHWLRRAGFVAHRFSYPSRRDGLADNARLLAGYVEATPGPVIHLVAHSLGGLVTLRMLAERGTARIGRIVLLGTPYAHCHCGFTVAGLPPLAALLGRTFADWFKQPPPTLPPTDIGVIAGTRRIGFGRLIPGLAGPNDGVVSVAETHIATARDHIALPVSHSGMLASPACARQVAHFLRTGSFIHG
jgi:pimeloyl-ACP methyl ester carboxylesterase